jgi:hypothetical protein
MSRRSITARRLAAATAACLVAAAGESGTFPAASREVRVRASEAFAPCLAPALAAFTRETGVRATLEVKDPDPADGADVVVGDDSELTRVLEGGAADLASAFDLGYIPWVFVAPAGSPADVTAAASAERLTVLGGRLGREARSALGTRLPADRLRLSRDRNELTSARYALVPRSLAGRGEQRPAGVRPLVAVAAAVRDSANAAGASRLLAFLKSARGRAVLSSCLSDASEVGTLDTAVAAPVVAAAVGYAAAVVDWWLPRCTIEHNGYNDPNQVLGPPDAVFLGVKDQYTGFMSLGQGGYVTVDMGASAIDGPGADVRVFQTTSNEPVTLYAATSPQGPFTLVGLRVSCGVRTGGGVFSFHCDFDLHDAGLSEARYFKVEDGEIYPCLKGSTITEGADIDAIQILNQKP